MREKDAANPAGTDYVGNQVKLYIHWHQHVQQRVTLDPHVQIQYFSHLSLSKTPLPESHDTLQRVWGLQVEAKLSPSLTTCPPAVRMQLRVLQCRPTTPMCAPRERHVLP